MIHKPDIYRLLCSSKDLNFLLQIHARLIVSGIVLNTSASTHLINSYSSFQKCDFARSVFDFTPKPCVIVWNSMIRSYTRSNRHEEALKMYHCMVDQSIEPDKYTFTFVLKASTGMSDLQEGALIHRDVIRKGLELDVFIGTGLVDMYCKTGDMETARDVFGKMPRKDIAAWNAMIAGLSQSPEPLQALCTFRAMQRGGFEPNSVSLLNLFPAVCKLQDIKSCKTIHGYLCRRGFSLSVTNGLIDMYAKCRDMPSARNVFDLMQGPDDVSWGTMMAGYIHNGYYLEVLELFDDMNRENLKMNKVSAVSSFLAAAEMRDLDKGMEMHKHARQQRIDSNILVATPLITMYAKCGELAKAKKLFWELQGKDLVAWSAVIAAFAQAGYPREALSLFRNMQFENLKPNKVTLVSVLPACSELLALKQGKSLHCYIFKANDDSDISVGTALVSMYAKCSCFSSALLVFHRILLKEVVTWNALINGYAQVGDPYNALEMFYQLRLSGVQPDSGTMVGVIPSCAVLGDLGQGACLHGQTIKCGLESDRHVKNALVDMYAKCGSLSSSEFLFNLTEFTKDEVSWNTIITGYMQNGCAKEAVAAFHRMIADGFQPNLVTIVSILPAVAHLAALKGGMAIHGYITSMGFQSHTAAGNNLIDMYAKCGYLDYAEKFFKEMENKDTISWNAMLSGYAMHGHGNSAISFFSLMLENLVEVDSVSFLSVLSACRHSGLIVEGKKIFNSMLEKHRVEPYMEHYACMVDLLGRAGLFDEITGLIETMPMEPDAAVWGALLAACRMYSKVKLAEVALNHLIKLEPRNPAHHVVLSSIYAQHERWHDAGITRLKIKETGLNKNLGWSRV